MHIFEEEPKLNWLKGQKMCLTKGVADLTATEVHRGPYT